MAKRRRRLDIPDAIIQPEPKGLRTKPQTQVIIISDEKVVKSLKYTSTPIYQIKVNHPSLRRRRKPWVGSEQVGLITDQGIYDVYNEVDGWAQLEDTTWVMLEFCSKIE